MRRIRRWSRRARPGLLVGLSSSPGRAAAACRAGASGSSRRSRDPGAAQRANLVVSHKPVARLTLRAYARRRGLPLLVWTVDGPPSSPVDERPRRLDGDDQLPRAGVRRAARGQATTAAGDPQELARPGSVRSTYASRGVLAADLRRDGLLPASRTAGRPADRRVEGRRRPTESERRRSRGRRVPLRVLARVDLPPGVRHQRPHLVLGGGPSASAERCRASMATLRRRAVRRRRWRAHCVAGSWLGASSARSKCVERRAARSWPCCRDPSYDFFLRSRQNQATSSGSSAERSDRSPDARKRRVGPREAAAAEGDPGRGVHLDHRRRCAARVASPRCTGRRRTAGPGPPRWRRAPAATSSAARCIVAALRSARAGSPASSRAQTWVNSSCVNGVSLRAMTTTVVRAGPRVIPLLPGDSP